MAYTAPRTWVEGEYPTAAQFNQDIRDNVSFLANPPACRVYHNANQSLANGAETTLAFNSERFDTANMHDTVTNNSRITIPTAGLYLLTFSAVWQVAADYQWIYVYPRLNGGTQIGVGTSAAPFNSGSIRHHSLLTTVYKFAAGDYVEIRAAQANSAVAARTLDFIGNGSPEFSATWIGLG